MVNEIEYQSRLGDIYYFVFHLIKKGLNEWSQLEMVRDRSGGIRELLNDPQIWEEEKRPKGELLKEIEEKILKENTAKVTNYKKWIINYGLVMLCSVFDQFLFDLVSSTLEKNPTLCTWTKKEDILSDFEHKKIKEKKQIIVNKLKISEEEFFDFKAFNQEIQTKFKDASFIKLFEIYEKRDKASHTDTFTLNDLNEFLEIKQFFEKLIFILSLKFYKKWNIDSAFIKIIVSNKK